MNILLTKIDLLTSGEKQILFLIDESRVTSSQSVQNLKYGHILNQTILDIFDDGGKSRLHMYFMSKNIPKMIKSYSFSAINLLVMDNADDKKNYLTKELISKKKDSKILDGMPTLAFLTQVSKDLSKLSEQFPQANIQLNITILGLQNSVSITNEKIELLFLESRVNGMIG